MRHGKLRDRINANRNYTRFCHRCGNIFISRLPSSKYCIKCFKPNGIKTAKIIIKIGEKLK